MTRYHFQVRAQSHVALTEIADLPSADDARIEAARRVGILLTEHAKQLWVDEDWKMDVTDETGLILFSIQISAMNAAATMWAKQKPAGLLPRGSK